MAVRTFSKSSYLIFKQCPKYFWYYINNRASIPEHDKRAKFNFALGHIVGELAKLCFSGGLEVGYDNDFEQNLMRTENLLKERKPLFEAGVLSKNEFFNVYSRADILDPVGQHSWDIIEVKSSTGVKDVNLYDVAFQKYCYERAGIKVNKCYLMYINNQYLRRGGIDVNSLFAKADVTEMVDKICPHIKNDLKQMLKVATDENFILQSGESAPEDGVGKFCENPFNCPLKPVCWKNVDKNSIYSLYSVTQKVINRLVLQNIKLICEIPDDFEGMNLKQKIQISCVKNSKPHIDRNAIAEFISKVSFPVCFLDFETFASPVPLIDLTKPYQGIPFQFSLHVLEDPDGYPRHLSFLASGNSDPRAQLLKSLKENFLSVKPDEDRFDGSIIVYNESFERSILRDLAVFDPSYADWIYMISSKIVDLYEPFRNFNYYNKLQNGSASVKKVLPALTDKSYENLEISNGDAANISFLEKSDLWDRFIKEYKLKDKFKAVYNNYSGTEGNEDEEKIIEKLRQDLHNYCKLDTEGMVDIYRELVSIAGKF